MRSLRARVPPRRSAMTPGRPVGPDSACAGAVLALRSRSPVRRPAASAKHQSWTTQWGPANLVDHTLSTERRQTGFL